MKTDFDHLPDDKQQHIQLIKDVLLDAVDQATESATGKKKNSRILMIILFGSYAKGTWVNDPKSGYQSDYDILVVLNKSELIEEFKIWYAAEEHIERKTQTPVNLIVHTLSEVNHHLSEGHYFFNDIYQEGALVYTNGESTLDTPGSLDPEEAKQIAQKHFDQWFDSANEFYEQYEFAKNKSRYKLAAFELHQTTERLFATILLVYSNYKPRTHNLRRLYAFVIQQDDAFKEVFLQDTKFQRRCFDLLRRAYIDARYSEHYRINEEELDWLAGRVQRLIELTQEKCTKK